MANPAQVADALHLIAVSLPWRIFNNDEEEAIAVAGFCYPLRDYTDNAAVTAAANEWLATMTRFPTPMEFADLVRKHHKPPERAAIEGGTAPRLVPPIGKAGSEGLAAEIVMKRMMRAVAQHCPKGFFGRLAYGNNDRHVEALSRDGLDERAPAYAALAYEQAVDFQDSTVTWDAWDGEPRGDVVVACRNASCDHGWVEHHSVEKSRDVVRVKKCTECGGPKVQR